VQFVVLPAGGGVVKFLRDFGPTVARLDRCIDAARYIQCCMGGNGGLYGDWGAVTAERAIRKGRKFALASDCVLPDCHEARATESRGLDRLKWRAKARLVRAWQHRLVARCELMFCTGLETYQAFTPVCRSPGVTHMVHSITASLNQLMQADAVA